MVKQIPDAGMLRHTHDAIQTNDTAVELSSVPNVCRIEWWCGRFSLLQIAATQLFQIYESCNIGEIILGIYDLALEDSESSKEHCRMIDEILTGDIFTSLRRVQLSQISSWIFPNSTITQAFVCR